MLAAKCACSPLHASVLQAHAHTHTQTCAFVYDLPCCAACLPRSMCLFIQNQNFERYTENMLNRLAEGAGYAQEQLAAAAKSSTALKKQTAELGRKAEATLDMLHKHSELEQVCRVTAPKERLSAAAL